MQFIHKKLVAAVSGAVFIMAGQLALADSTNDLVDALVTKGVLTEEEGKLLTKGHQGEVDGTKKKEKSYARGSFNFRGYTQARNTPVISGDDGINLWSDRSVGDDSSLNNQDHNFLIRRMRMIFYGDVGDRLYYYVQPDLASSIGGTSNSNVSGAGGFAQLRDAYGDIYITKNKVHRIRVGQSKVPYGFENMQSSQNRLALDRVDAMNSAVRDERDLGAFYYYTPENVQALFKEIQDGGLKHSGNYGMLALGIYNGQGANARDMNDNYHVVARATYPWKTESGQIFEMGIQGYHGEYVPVARTYNATGGTTATLATADIGRITATSGGATLVTRQPRLAVSNGIADERVGLSFMMYPQPFGLEAEWNWGKTPGLDIATNTIQEKSLNGGYVQTMYKIDNFKFLDTNGTLIPFLKWQYFDGYNKAEDNAPRNQVNDWELGMEWQIAPEVELVAEYHRMKRNNLVTGNTNNRLDYARFEADVLRLQLQWNY
ncbi:porin [Candidatus Methylopumilus rimovensis]|uniref:Porin n=2 Tax=Candidatus Methylopumilus rimovensis TaxID=2588535 RepID=A0AAE6FSZ3_9PROT|nr:porin [Candidatus Methylopumilus rimovensis]